MLGSGGTAFYKLSGAGNDFIALLLDGDDAPPAPDRLRRWCRRGVSIGADGVLMLRRTPTGARMLHWNADGSRAELCLNGSRSAVRLIFELGWVGADDRLELETDSGTLVGRRLTGSRASVSLPPALAGNGDDERSVRPVSLAVDGGTVQGHWLDVGVPHLVVERDDLEALPIDRLGPALRHHVDLGPRGANVNFVVWPEPGRGNRFGLRTWERGVEAETLACGSGAVAVVRTGLVTGRSSLPATAQTASGFELTLDRDAEGRLTLAGDARIVARGELFDDAEASPKAH